MFEMYLLVCWKLKEERGTGLFLRGLFNTMTTSMQVVGEVKCKQKEPVTLRKLLTAFSVTSKSKLKNLLPVIFESRMPRCEKHQD